MSRRVVLAALAALLAVAAAAVAGLNVRGEAPISPDARPVAGTPAQVARGAELARAGNCATCHTARGGAPYAGGRGIATPFGTVYAGNLTPDVATGLGAWSPDHFWRALHHGRSKDGRLLYPAFPYPQFTRVTRDDADALYAFLRSLPPVVQANRAHALRFPFDSQAALAVWRALFFRPGVFEPEPGRGAEWNRGAYLVRGLGHCEACHGERNLLGATQGGLELNGGLIPMRHWYAPSLASAREASVADWPVDEIVALLRTGAAPRGVALGPMGDVVLRSTQYLPEADLRAIAVFLKSLPQVERPAPAAEPVAPARLAEGERLYADHCAACHGAQGEGADGLIPPLAGNRTVTMDPPANLVRVIVNGGFAPATASRPRPFGMPPFAHTLDDDQIAAVATFLRRRWGANAAEVGAREVTRFRAAASD